MGRTVEKLLSDSSDPQPELSQRVYQGEDVALIVPTKDRPVLLRLLLTSLVGQTVGCRRIIVIEGGASSEEVVMSFAGALPVEYCHSDRPGQIRQRNTGLRLLKEQDRLVGFIDDDIVLEPDALEEMICFWNRCDSRAAGVSFNVFNNMPVKHGFARKLFGMGIQEPGRILRSGYNSPIGPISESIRSEWLCGGATVWRRAILDTHTNLEIDTCWASSEDVAFSYPIGKRYPLFVCATAKVSHGHANQEIAAKDQRYSGERISLWRLSFAASHPELSIMRCVWMLLGQILLRMGYGMVTWNADHVRYGQGQWRGLIRGLFSILVNGDFRQLLHDEVPAKN